MLNLRCRNDDLGTEDITVIGLLVDQEAIAHSAGGIDCLLVRFVVRQGVTERLTFLCPDHGRRAVESIVGT